ncbi:MAG TPA: tRNA (N6-isopentenyl adenosine(37)-C2)-methylthiotransferase MiaB [Synergistaceae bacterium]|nr:tRNA (N6-isopentenyl adenosine(37)-C2)-methylthiotransferase MiaB [Synergistaceae bacterium]HPR89955.1 tRNA (N6-isopentenyl adenosine(37)-C2)-methylthiotransferase MiaB [Synergistaceae bacterium]
MHRFALKIYGCQMNVYDGDKIRTALVARGWRESPEDEADLVILNGCSIRDKAEQKVWSDLGRFAVRWKNERKPIVAVTGCVAQSVGRRMAARFPWVRFVSGPRHIGAVPDALEQFFNERDAGRTIGNEETVFLLDDDPRAFLDLPGAPTERVNRWKAFVTIAHGCDNFCSYCIVPYVRGRFVSRPAEDILEEMRTLVADGVLEITLLGQNVNSYGSDFSDGYRFSSLLRDAAASTGVRLLRFVTSHPRDFTPDIVEAMAEHTDILCPSINLPIQSGSDRILKMMNRGYTLEQYRAAVSLIRNHLPGAGLTTDLIVGHPGETDDDFQCSVNALREFRFDLVHSAAYSPREGTSAAAREDQIPREVKMARLNEINRIQSLIAREINESLVGSRFSVLLDDVAPRGEGILQGRTPSDKVVLVEGGEELLGRFVSVEITCGENWCLNGRVLHVEN